MIQDEPVIESPEAGISRRRMLKRIGAGAAVAWTAPILTSIRTPAFAQSPSCDCPPFNCESGQQLCENGCFCSPHHGGGPCVCWGGGLCSNQAPICATDADCAPFGPDLACGDVDPNCGCAGSVACLETGDCLSRSQHRGPLKGIRKV